MLRALLRIHRALLWIYQRYSNFGVTRVYLPETRCVQLIFAFLLQISTCFLRMYRAFVLIYRVLLWIYRVFPRIRAGTRTSQNTVSFTSLLRIYRVLFWIYGALFRIYQRCPSSSATRANCTTPSMTFWTDMYISFTNTYVSFEVVYDSCDIGLFFRITGALFPDQLGSFSNLPKMNEFERNTNCITSKYGICLKESQVFQRERDREWQSQRQRQRSRQRQR